MYPSILAIHNILRWAVVILALISVYQAFVGVIGKKPFSGASEKTSLFFMISVDLQFLFGLILYFFVSPVTKNAFSDMSATMKDPDARFWTIEHSVMMLAAIILIHIGRSRSKKAADDFLKHRTLLIFYGIAVLIMLAAIPWPFGQHPRPWLPM